MFFWSILVHLEILIKVTSWVTCMKVTQNLHIHVAQLCLPLVQRPVLAKCPSYSSLQMSTGGTTIRRLAKRRLLARAATARDIHLAIITHRYSWWRGPPRTAHLLSASVPTVPGEYWTALESACFNFVSLVSAGASSLRTPPPITIVHVKHVSSCKPALGESLFWLNREKDEAAHQYLHKYNDWCANVGKKWTAFTIHV